MKDEWICHDGPDGYQHRISTADGETICDVGTPMHVSKIMAAPDLLEACKLARHICEEGNALQQQLDAAISKAERYDHLPHNDQVER